MEISYMKEYILKKYPHWKDKINHIKTSQVIAMYYSMCNREQRPKKEKKIKLQNSDKYHQMTIAEYLTTEENKSKDQQVETEQYHQMTIGEYLVSLKQEKV